MFLRMYTGVTTWWSDLKERAADEGGAVSYTHLTLPTILLV